MKFYLNHKQLAVAISIFIIGCFSIANFYFKDLDNAKAQSLEEIGEFLYPRDDQKIDFDQPLNVKFRSTEVYGPDNGYSIIVGFVKKEPGVAPRDVTILGPKITISKAIRERNSWLWQYNDWDISALDKNEEYYLIAQVINKELLDTIRYHIVVGYVNSSQNNYVDIAKTGEDNTLYQIKGDRKDLYIFELPTSLKTGDEIHILGSSAIDFRSDVYLYFENTQSKRLDFLSELTRIQNCQYRFSQSEINFMLENNYAFCYVGFVPKKNPEELNGKYNFWATIYDVYKNDSNESQADFTSINIDDSEVQSAFITFNSTGIIPTIDQNYIAYEEENDITNKEDTDEIEDGLSFTLSQSCQDLRIYDEEDCRQFLAIIDDNIDEQCIEASIYDSQSCEDYLRLKTVESLCQAESIVDTEACKDFMLEKYASTVECKLDDLVECTTILRDKYFNRLVSDKIKQEKIANSTEGIYGQTFSVAELQAKLLANNVNQWVLPLKPSDTTKVLVAKAQEETVLESSNQLTTRNRAVIILDNDHDGLSDDSEIYYGTDPNNPDTDGDGFLDGEEVKNGYNPNGEGLFEKELSNLDAVVLSQNDFEQPKNLSEKYSDDLSILVNNDDENNIKFQGKSQPNTWLNIFLYSDLPLVMTVKTDASGNWTYNLKESLADGSHKVYVTVNDDTGKIVKQSDPLAFLVKEAKAVGAQEYFQTDEDVIDQQNNIFWFYIFGALFLIVLGVVFVIFLHTHSKKEF